MMDKLIWWSIQRRWFVIMTALCFVVAGLYVCATTPVDVFPDLTAPTVVVLTEAPGYSPAEVESLVTFPLETALNGAVGVRRVRSVAMPEFSVVWAEFDWIEDMHTARQTVAERVTLALSEIPEDIPRPVLAPPTSLMGEIQVVALQSDRQSLSELQHYADNMLRRRLLSVPGIAQVTTVGSGERQYQLVLDPERLASTRITVSEIAEALQRNNLSIPAGVISEGGTEYLLSGAARLRGIKDIEEVVVDTRDGVPIRIADLGETRIGASPVRGTASANGRPAVLLFLQRQPQANTMALDRALDRILAEEAARLPEGTTLETGLMKQADFIRRSVRNVAVAIRDGALLMIAIIALFLMSGRAMTISLTALPISLIAAVLTIRLFGGTINTMTLGGLAIAIGSLMDDAVIDVENTVRRLRQNAARTPAERRSPLRVVYEGSSEVRAAIVAATGIITVVFLPLFTLENVEGRLLQPLGTAYIVSIFASLLVALTLTPALEALLLPGSRMLLNVREARFAAWVRCRYARLLGPVMRHPWAVTLPVALFLLGAVVSFFGMGRAFLPDFNEGALNLVVSTLPGTSLEESNRIGSLVESLLMDIPEITSVARKTGRGELDEHAQGVEGSELEATFALDTRSKSDLLQDIRSRLETVPGISHNIGGPIAHRIDHILSGARAGIAIKFFGDDLQVLRDLGREAEGRLERIAGVVDVAVEPQTNVPQIQVRPDRTAMARHGIRPEETALTLRAAVYGATVTRVLEGRFAYDLALRFGADTGKSVGALSSLPVLSDSGAPTPLNAIAAVERIAGPNVISREQGQRKLTVTCNPAGRDITSVLAAIRDEIDPLVAGRTGYSVQYGGQFESAAAASRRLLISGTAVIAGVFALLCLAFKNMRDAVFVMAALPFALIGGVVAVYLAGGTLSIASIIGFISVFGVAARNGVMLINHIRHLQMEEGVSDFAEAVRRGAEERIVPVLMTALSTGLALVPLVLHGDAPGNEIQSPMALVIIGGLLSATFLNMLVVPALYLRFGRPARNGAGTDPALSQNGLPAESIS